MKFENTKVYNFDGALRGMRNPKDSWKLSDSEFGICLIDELNPNDVIIDQQGKLVTFAHIGPKDKKLAQTLIKGGSVHRKFMRQIFVSVDITAPLFWWKEADTYRIGVVANSTSTMHTIQKKPITLDSFEIDDYDCAIAGPEVDSFINFLESLRLKFVETQDKKYWKELIRWLPESWLQTRTVTMSYENLLAMCSKDQRRSHKLNEWSGKDDNSKMNFIAWARSLPYAQDLIFFDEVIEENETKIKSKESLIDKFKKILYNNYRK